MKDKSQRIIDIVEYLQTKYGASNILIKHHWDSDENAIGLTDKTEKFLAYISTISENDNGFYLALENPPLDEGFPYSPVGDFDNINLTKLEELVTKHLQVDNY
jgi:hypothetical protein